MATLRLVQRGTATLIAGSGGTSVTATLGTALLDTAKSLLLFSYSPSSDRSQRGLVQGVLTNSTTLTFSRDSVSTNPAITITWQVIEWTSGVTVQRGTTDMAGSAGLNVTINTRNLSKSWVVLGGAVTQLGDWLATSWAGGWLTGTTTLRLERGLTHSSPYLLHWQVIEYDNCSVQANTVTFATGDTVKPVTVTSADPAKSWLVMAYKASSSAAGRIGEKLIRGEQTSPTTLAFTRDVDGTAVTVGWSLITFTDDTIVQSSQLAFAAQTALQATLAPMDITRAFVCTAGFHSCMGSTPQITPADASVSAYQLTLTSTALTATRGGTSSGGTLQWYVIEFPEPVLSEAWGVF